MIHLVRRLLVIVLLNCAFVCFTTASTKHQVSVKSFGAVPNDGINDAAALRAAASYCRLHAGTVLFFPPGTYDFKDEDAQRIEREAISGAYGEDVQGHLFQPKLHYVKALDFTSCSDLQINAYGATLLLHGWYEVVSLVRTHHVAIKGLSILYQRPPSTVGRIISSNASCFDMHIDSTRYCYLDSIVTGRVHFFSNERKLIYFCNIKKKELINRSTIRMYTNSHPAVGDYCILRHSGHYRPCIMVRESSDVAFKDVCIFSQPGMGIVGHLSNDILLDNVQVVPEPGNVISTNTDATHFTSCSGKLTIENCKFKGNGDDCTNIHNYYYFIYPESPKRVEIRIQDADLHAQWLDYPQIGDTMLVLNRKNMQAYDKYVVQRVDTSYDKWKVSIVLNKPLNLAHFDEYYMTNLTRFPHVYIVNNTVNNHLGRGFLVKSPNVYIARNSICNTTHTAIKLGAEISWHESGPAYNVLIENNYISGCGYLISPTDAACVYTSTESPQTPPQVNKHIVIRNNVFDTDKKYTIVLKDASDVQIYNNRSSHQNDVFLENCSSVDIK